MRRLSQYALESMPHIFADLFSDIQDDVISKACQANPWFTPYYIRFSQQAIRGWFDPHRFFSFHTSYALGQDTAAKKVGIIMAGNVPWVGLHDLIMCWLSGNKAFIKFSHQDTILMKWFVESAIEALPELKEYVEITNRIPDVDFILATGSNNTARYFNHHFRQTPRIIRHNRFSVAVLNEKTSENQLRELAKDLFLYNGLGCRNVSNLMISKSVDPQEFWNIWEDESIDWLNPLYLKKVQVEKAKMGMGRDAHLSGASFIARESTTLSSTPMGVFNMIRFQSEESLEAYLLNAKDNIQCIVGQELAYGRTQIPDIDDFADNIDSLKLLSAI